MKKRYFEDLDGLRFYVFLMILAHHIGLWAYDHGHTFFFALSGFLIGYNTISPGYLNREFSLKQYLIRRALRTFPVYFLVLLICGLTYLIFKHLGDIISIDNYWTYFLFIQNYFTDDSLFILKNLWAMAVIEQLYLGWGIIMAILHKRIGAYLFWLATSFIIIAFVIAAFSNVVYSNTLTYAGIFLLGSYLASLYHKQNALFIYIQNVKPLTRQLLLFLLAVCIISGFFILTINNYALKEHVMAILFFAFLMMLCYKRSSAFSIFSNFIVSYFGKLSYGLYCYHAIVITAVTKYLSYKGLSFSSYYLFLVCLVLTIAISTISYELYEKKFLKMKQSFR